MAHEFRVSAQGLRVERTDQKVDKVNFWHFQACALTVRRVGTTGRATHFGCALTVRRVGTRVGATTFCIVRFMPLPIGRLAQKKFSKSQNFVVP